MRLLLVEDRIDTIDAIRSAVANMGGDIDLTVAVSRTSALTALENAVGFDLIVCDLRIPPTDESVEADIVHGDGVFRRVRELFPGTPVILFTAYGTLELAQQVIDEPASGDCFGTGHDQPLVVLRTKDQLDGCIAAIEEALNHVRSLAAIEIGAGGFEVKLGEMEARVLRVYARRVGGRVIRVAQVDGGLSGARPLVVEARASTGELAALVLAKLGSLEEIEDERSRFDTYVAPRLPQAAFPHLTGIVRAGAGRAGGLFYSLAEDYPKSLFAVLAEDDASAAAVVDRVALYTSRWTDGRSAVERSVGSLRETLVSDVAFNDLRPLLAELDTDRVEALPCHAGASVQHGDLHGQNVLVSSGGEPILIDFGSVLEAWAALDPVTLELSILFHPSGARIRGTWPSKEQACDWHDLDSYIAGCPVPEFIRACRDWGWRMAIGDRELFGTAYAYAARQLQYQDIDRDLAVAVSSGAGSRLLLT